jgi:opacity protein-like surface antigen
MVNKLSVRRAIPASLMLLMFARPGLVQAQSGAVVSGAIGVAVVDDAADLEVSGSIGYRFNRAIGFGLEFTHVPDFETTSQYGYSALRICCGLPDQRAEGHATVFTTNFRVDVPTTMRRVLPFVVGGGGIASVTEKFPLIYYAVPLASELASLGLSIPAPNIRPGPPVISNTTLAMALTLGGGVSLMLTNHLAVEPDLRVLKLLADNSRTIGRFQVGASYRF